MSIPGPLLRGLGDVASAPITQAFIRYSWLTIPVGYLAWRCYQKHAKKGPVDIVDLINEMGPMLSITLSVIALDATLRGLAAPTTVTVASPAPPMASFVAPNVPITFAPPIDPATVTGPPNA